MKKAVFIHFFFFLLLLSWISFSETLLKGDISEYAFQQNQSPFIINDNITVPRGKKVEIEAGCVFLFKADKGVIIEGELIVKGTSEKPVVFTTINDNQYSSYPEKMKETGDWAGIEISASASKVQLSYFILSYSVFGIKSIIEEVDIQNGTFLENLIAGFTINDRIKVDAGNKFNYYYGNNSDVTPFFKSKTSLKPDISSGADLPSVKNSPENKKLSSERTYKSTVSPHYGIPILLGSIGLAAGVVSGVFGKKIFDTQTAYQDERDASVRSSLETKGTQQITISAVSGAICLISLPAAIIIHKKKSSVVTRSSDVSISPVITSELMGAVFKANF